MKLVFNKARFSILSTFLLFSNNINSVIAQQSGNYENEEKPTITLKECTNSGGCISTQSKLTLDSNWRWVHETSGYENCYTGNRWTSSKCTPTSDPGQCAQNCALEGVSADKYLNTYGIEQVDNGVKINFVTEHPYGTNVGARLYLMENDEKYKMFYLKNREFAIDIDVSNLFCGMNGAMYFVEMEANGGKGLNNNQAGAKYGTGYCDAQCPHDMKFISGEANNVNWIPNPKDLSNNMGIGKYGSCCAEMDIWEANSMATAYTPHTCDPDITQYRCEGTKCGDNASGERYDGVCDKDGCDINPFRMGNQNFYGRGDEYTVNTLKPMTVVTQFITDDGTDDGDLVEIRRFYVQDGNIIHSPSSTILEPSGLTDSDSITDQFCEDKKILFEDVNDYQEKGGTKGMGDSLDRGQVAVLSLWDDVEVNMLWLDSAYPLNKDAAEPGVLRGDCPGDVTSTPTYVRDNFPDGHVIFRSAAIGEIGSTLQVSPTQSPTPAPCDYCGPVPGQNTPECSNKPYADCMNMMNNEGKCFWNECSDPSSPTRSPTKDPTPAPTPLPTARPTTSEGDSPTNSPTKSHDCKSWCGTSPTPWEQKCDWFKCKLCDQCVSITDSPTSTPVTPSPTFNPTRSPSHNPSASPTGSSTNGGSPPTVLPTGAPTIEESGSSDDDLSSSLSELISLLSVLTDLLNEFLSLFSGNSGSRLFQGFGN